MNTDDLQSAWQSLDKRLDRENQLNWESLRDKRLAKVNKNLRPLVWGQCIQIVFGICIILLAVAHWSSPFVSPVTATAGLLVHIYGVLCVIAAGVVLNGLRDIDYARPVLSIQTQLAKVRKHYIMSGMIVGLPWWFMWLAVIIVLAGLGGIDFYTNSPWTVWSGVLVGVVGVLATAVFHFWSRSKSRPKLARYMNDAVTGRSLRFAASQLEELKRFETDGS